MSICLYVSSYCRSTLLIMSVSTTKDRGVRHVRLAIHGFIDVSSDVWITDPFFIIRHHTSCIMVRCSYTLCPGSIWWHGYHKWIQAIRNLLIINTTIYNGWRYLLLATDSSYSFWTCGTLPFFIYWAQFASRYFIKQQFSSQVH